MQSLDCLCQKTTLILVWYKDTRLKFCCWWAVLQKKIALQIGVHTSTISREIKRNTAQQGKLALDYKAFNAQCRADLRHQQKPKHRIFNSGEKQRVFALLTEQKWSPELISRVVRKEGEVMVSTERIYQWIWACKHSNCQQDQPFKKAYQHLRHGRRRPKRGNRKDSRGIIHGRVSIDLRPSVVRERSRVGDVEVDLMMGKAARGAVLVMTDRATL